MWQAELKFWKLMNYRGYENKLKIYSNNIILMSNLQAFNNSLESNKSTINE